MLVSKEYEHALLSYDGPWPLSLGAQLLGCIVLQLKSCAKTFGGKNPLEMMPNSFTHERSQ